MPRFGLPSHPSTRTLPGATPLACLVLVSVSACAYVSPTPPAEHAGTGAHELPYGARDLPGADHARDRLEVLPRLDRRPADVPAYERTAFGSAWADVDRNGCNQRDDVLLRDAVAGSSRVAPQGGCDHDVLAGTWTDPYTGRQLVLDDLKEPRQAQAVQIDHVVPLAEAWRSGAWAWAPERRRAFANSLDALLAVDGPTNAAKGDDDPAAWRPRAAHQCTYALRWVAIKGEWKLGADDSERAALEQMLDTCA